MNLKNRSKVSADFNMSSMTDMVFLLLIFFMLTSTLVTTNALEIQLPKSDATNVKKANVSVTIDEELRFSIDNDIVDAAELEQGILQAVNNNPEAVLIIRADQSVPTGETVRVLDIAYRNQIKVVLATDPN
jgi:biopolymer transport protein ExbD